MTDFAQLVLDADTRGLRDGARDLDRFKTTSRETAGEVDRSSGRMARAFGVVATAAAAAFSFNEIITTNAEFGASMQRVAAISGATGAQFDELRAKALEMGRSTQFSASQAADALGFLAMAGFSASEAVASLPAVLDLAAASGMDLARAADIASNVLSGFGLAADEAAVVSDVLAAASSRTNTNVEQLGSAMSTVAPIAAAMGISLEETAAAIGRLSDAGIQGERAGTALRGVMAALAGVTPQAAEALANYGLTAADVNPETVGLAEAMRVLNDAGLSTADAMTIFGREAASGALVLAGTAESVTTLTRELENADGAAANMAATMRDNLAGDISGLRSAFEGLIIQIGDSGTTGVLRTLAQVGTNALRILTESMGLVTAAAGGAAAAFVTYQAKVLLASAASSAFGRNLLLVGSMTATVTSRVGALAGAKVALAGATGAATGAFRALTAAMIANPFGAVAAAVGILSAAFIGLGNAQRQARAETDNLIRSLRALAQARSADFAVQINTARTELNEVQSEYDRAVARRDALMRQRGSARNEDVLDARIRAANAEITRLGTSMLGMRNTINLAEQDFRRAGEAAESIEVPVSQTVAPMAAIASSAGTTASNISAANDNMRELETTATRLVERLFPIEARIGQYNEDLQDLTDAMDAGLISADRYAQAVRRLRRELADVNVEGPTRRGLMVGVPEEFPEIDMGPLERMGEVVDIQTGFMSEAFARMAGNIANTIQGLSRIFGESRFLDILAGVTQIFGQFAGAGVFGSNLQRVFQGFGGFGGFRANGGAVSAGTTYLVGERGPELFTAPGNGRIVSNDNMPGPMRIEVVPSPYFDVRVNGQIMQTAPGIAQAGAALAQTQAAQNGRYAVSR